ncbi:restriction endonuclease [Fimbriiglobus ruber]|uniref:restriction endonuclease n=1 Tax=Fimbriiglobus ruber TaxID=1908690 RepID=UPI000B4AF132|nr:restriction endonuclease [Fimbriiglobus ruber]
MPTQEDYEKRIRAMKWPQLRKLWKQIRARDTPDWDSGKAFEYLVLRMFELDGARVRWPYLVKIGSEITEEIDGSVKMGSLYSLIESKDERDDIAIVPIAKLRNQLLRRPSGTIGMVFSASGFTPAAILLTQFVANPPILLWTGREIEYALNNRKIVVFCESKYRIFVDTGMPEFDIYGD